MRIAFITGNYPSQARPFEGTFVQQFVWAMARQGNNCSVIRPCSVFDGRYGPYPPVSSVEDAGVGHPVRVLRPRYISFSSRDLGFTHTGRWTQRTFNVAAASGVRRLPQEPELLYGHFLYQAGYAALTVGRVLSRPSVIGVGEDHFWTLTAHGEAHAREHFANQGFFLANSTPNGEGLVRVLGISPERVRVELNGVDLRLMYARDAEAMRRQHGIDESKFTIAFVGANEERKGPMRMVAAAQQIQGVQCILAGAGTQKIDHACVVRKGPCAHREVPELLACADVFVLPTLSEGSCNAVIEAIACGLPIVTSKGCHMDDIVDDQVAIRVDPSNVGEIRAAIEALKDDPERRRRMSEACLKKARRFDINERARRVTAWMEELVRAYQA